MSDTPRTDCLMRLLEWSTRIERKLNKAKAENIQLRKQLEFFRKGIKLRDAELKRLRSKK